MKQIPPTPRNCDHCGNNYTVMFAGKIGGVKSRICGECVIKYANLMIERAHACGLDWYDKPAKFGKQEPLEKVPYDDGPL
jgi:hypothetical protein